jgi:glycosyltransferase involved in cell wall biosynthesis
MKEAAELKIALVGMEELPALTALRLRQAGYAGARALEGVRGFGLLRAVKPYDVFHAVYPVYYLKWVPALRAMGKKVVFHWIGSDWYELGQNRTRRALFRTGRGGVDLHIADAPWLVEELAAAGLAAHLVPTISEKMHGQVEAMPARFRVMAYVPDRRRDFYGWPTVKHVAGEFPEVEFVAVGGQAEAGAPGNVRFTGLVDGEEMDRLYREASVLIRPTAHDGLSQMVLEALLRGRQVVWTRDFPHCVQATSAEEFAAAVGRLVRDCPRNDEGARYVRENYSAAAAARALAAAYEALTAP